MAVNTISCTFDKDAVWKKVHSRKSVVLDMNCWINMGDGKFSSAIQTRKTLARLVDEGRIFCPLSGGLICELYKQAEDSRLRVGALMEELSLNVSYANREEIFELEVGHAIRRLVGVGSNDVPGSELYVPVAGYICSHYSLEFDAELPSDCSRTISRQVGERLQSLTFTELLKMRAGRKEDGIFEFMKQLPAPSFSDGARQTWEAMNGDKWKIQRIEAETIFKCYIQPAIRKLSLDVQMRFLQFLKSVPQNKWGFLDELLKHLPALKNHVEIMATITENPPERTRSTTSLTLRFCQCHWHMHQYLWRKTGASGTRCRTALRS